MRHNHRKIISPAHGVYKKLAAATTDLRSRISPRQLFFKKIGAAVLLRPSIPTSGVAGLFDFHFGQFGKAGLQPLPDPVSEIFARGIL